MFIYESKLQYNGSSMITIINIIFIDFVTFLRKYFNKCDFFKIYLIISFLNEYFVFNFKNYVYLIGTSYSDWKQNFCIDSVVYKIFLFKYEWMNQISRKYEEKYLYVEEKYF